MYVFLISFLWVATAQADFYTITSKRWTTVKEVKLNSRIKNLRNVDEPKGTDILLMELIMFNHEFHLVKDCVFFRVPNKDKAGHLYVHTILKKQECQSKILTSSGLELKEIYNFGVDLKDDFLTLKIDRSELSYRLWNLNNQSAVQVGILKKTARTTIFDGQTCYKINDACQVLFDNCDQCSGGRVNIVANKCSTDFNKICSSSGCGLKNQPACIRGYLATGFKGEYCFADSPVAYCKKNFRVFCEDSKLVCK